ncbi:MAG: hypothetical protein SGI84_02900 [Gemmatimonadota bacterium]|nr:hypothetical protein [Gemmatimonadota bacterium]
MVGWWPAARRGASTVGCLFTLALFTSSLYFGLPIGHSYWRYTRMVDEMRTTVRFAQTIADEQMVRQILLMVDQLELPREARRIRVTRNPTTRRIAIQTAWTETLALPFITRDIRYKPRVEGVY